MENKVTFELSQAVHAFLFAEAELLDSWRISEWLGFLDPSIRYFVPLRETRMKEDGTGFSKMMAMQDDDLAALETRARRLTSKASWSEIRRRGSDIISQIFGFIRLRGAATPKKSRSNRTLSSSALAAKSRNTT